MVDSMKRAFCVLTMTVLAMAACARIVLAGQAPKVSSILPEEFTSRLRQANLIFSPPTGFLPTRLNPTNGVQWYDFAMKSGNGKLEVRYAIKPWSTNDAQGSEVALLLAVLHNISQEDISGTNMQYSQLSSKTCKVLGADTGYITAPIAIHSDFSKDYRVCMVNWICAKGRGSAYIFYLFDDYAPVREQIYYASRSVRFIEKPEASQTDHPQ
jgi:hypothetical protein